MNYGMVIDLRRCVGCNACTVACKVSNGTPPEMHFSHVEMSEEGTYPNARTEYLPVLCQHCENAACVTVCPTGASYTDEDGVVRIDQDKCIGCRFCITSCPYDVRTYLAEPVAGYYPDKGLTDQEKALYAGYDHGCVYKCDFCASKGYIDSEQGPACVQTCPGAARIFGDLDDPSSEVSQLVGRFQTERLGEEYGTEPKVFYIARTNA